MLFNPYSFKKETAKLCQNEVWQLKKLGLKWYEFWEGTTIIQL